MNAVRTTKAKKVKTAARKRAGERTRVTAAAAVAPKTVRAGSKTEVVRRLLTAEGGCTTHDVLRATQWPSVSMPQMAKACGLELRKEKAKGEPTRYFGVPA